jgi:aspartate kinase
MTESQKKENKEEPINKVVEEQKEVTIKVRKSIVVRCGGSSVGSPEAIEAVVRWVKQEIHKGTKIVILASAIPSEREEMINFAQHLHPNPPAEHLNELTKYCDAKSAQMIAIALRRHSISFSVFNGEAIIIKPDPEAKVVYQIKPDNCEKMLHRIRYKLDQNVIVCSGFKIIEGKNKINTTVLRDSNSSAVVLAGLLGVDICIINTSTDGIFQVDPRIVAGARRIDYLSYHQMSRFAYMGARILSSRCVELAASLGVVVQVKLSPALGESRGGTIIGPFKLSSFSEEKGPSRGMAIQAKVVRFEISGSLKKLIASLPDICLIDSAIYSEAGGYVIVTEEDAEEVRRRIEKKNFKIKKEANLASLTLIDWQMLSNSGYINKIVEVLDKMIIAVTTAGDAISILVKRENIEKAARILAKTFSLVK